MHIRVCHKINFFEFLAPILVCHGDRYQKAPKKVSGPNMTISESASHFCKYKGNFKKYKGKYSLILFLKNNDFLFCPELSSHRTWFLKSRRVERHPSWWNCMHRKIACACNFWPNCMNRPLTVQFPCHAILPIWVSFNSSGLQESCPERWALGTE